MHKAVAALSGEQISCMPARHWLPSRGRCSLQAQLLLGRARNDRVLRHAHVCSPAGLSRQRVSGVFSLALAQSLLLCSLRSHAIPRSLARLRPRCASESWVPVPQLAVLRPSIGRPASTSTFEN
ncbi:hypothetical protein FA95DRAFT_399998 [Auriscalpium vulgare]|uniref:Uncharacterized protein n=1 Tax=Auriscalpium vulgare TaxID=40419 RepID=A0ACB8RH68_9AGAM|nr:hypothetical protein FA95DRAFT_399998 [Auriscalpium vulgare]